VAELEQLRPALLLVGVVIHAINSVVFGLIYGVLLPTLPQLPRPLAWGGLLMPLIWTALSYGLMGVVNPLLSKGVDWPWFIASQFVFGVVAAGTILRARAVPTLASSLVGGLAGGLAMTIPALLWGWFSGRGIWYPVNLLVGMVRPGMNALSPVELGTFRPAWLVVAGVIHLVMSLGLGLILALLLPRLRPIPAALGWGGLLLPLLWTAMSYGLMGVVNPILQERVDWPWFIASQFVFGLATAIVVDRSEKIYIPPAGRGPEPMDEFVEGSDGGSS
jgi:hypothetical protein